MATTKVGLETKANKIRLRLPRAVAGESNRYISTGLDSTPDNLKKAQIVAWTIEEDLQRGTLDPTLERYKESFRPKQTIQKQPDLLEIWLAYAEYKRPQVEETTWLKLYKRTLTNHIQSLPSHKPTDSSLICSYLLSNFSVAVTKRVLRYLSACCKWAKVQNNFSELRQDIREPKRRLRNIQPFSEHERDCILEYFRQHSTHYLPFVSFLFATGCRTGEAIGLRWANVAEDCSYVVFSESFDSDTKIRKSTKTGVSRRFPCNGQLKQLLQQLTRGELDSLVFTNKKGRPIHNSVFVSKVWKPSLSALVKEGKLTSYRRLYTTRHTFISHCLEAGVPVTTIASWVGNSPEILMRHYAGVVNTGHLPPQWG
ncbi:tyrosine-type recombinase/integrase [Fortiea contorta]|uniref:tyrosine-type recombinase/integrase n=1 Tax=Fortiea contorta TaxID=1892405 RepID=UPI00034D00C4|nr:tyrosine-type recombinase/integrase [Fortiea contorta]